MGFGRGRRWMLAALSFVVCGCASERGNDTAAVETEPKLVASASPPSSAVLVTTPPATPMPRCREQAAQEFLLRKGQIAKIGAPAAERKQIEAARQRSNQYRTTQYGWIEGVGKRSDNPYPPTHYAKKTQFMGRPVVVHEKIVPALACVEEALRMECKATPYQPRSVGGIRGHNTFKDYEVSNHLFGIAIDVDSHLNPCCGCVGHWAENPVCKKKVGSPFERMAMPRCWVETFERYGFYWLGHDELEDTMHFEFLGDPSRILE